MQRRGHNTLTLERRLVHMEALNLSIDEVLTTTRNVRKRLDLARPVERDVVESCLDLAMQAPNGSNNQSWEWIVVDDHATRHRMAEVNAAALAHFQTLLAEKPELLSASNVGRNDASMDRIGASVLYLIEHLGEVPVLVVPLIMGRLERANSFYQASQWGTIFPAAWSFMLALRSRGLGSALTTLHLWKEREMAEVLGVPYDKYTQAGLFPVAYTRGTEFRPGRRRPAAEVIHWNRW
jgi:nitroreductase